MTDQTIPLDAAATARRTASRYQRIIGDLVEEVAQLTTYASQLEQQIQAHQTPTPPPQADAWGDPAERKD